MFWYFEFMHILPLLGPLSLLGSNWVTSCKSYVPALTCRIPLTTSCQSSSCFLQSRSSWCWRQAPQQAPRASNGGAVHSVRRLPHSGCTSARAYKYLPPARASLSARLGRPHTHQPRSAMKLVQTFFFWSWYKHFFEAGTNIIWSHVFWSWYKHHLKPCFLAQILQECFKTLLLLWLLLGWKISEIQKAATV